MSIGYPGYSGVQQAANSNELALDALYNDRAYFRAYKSDWVEWFAWYPVYIRSWEDHEQLGVAKTTSFAWLRKVYRRRVEYTPAGTYSHIGHEYVDFSDLLKLSGVKMWQLLK